MASRGSYFSDLNALLQAMPPGKIDMALFATHELRHRHRLDDPPALVERWLLDQQARVQGATLARVTARAIPGGSI